MACVKHMALVVVLLCVLLQVNGQVKKGQKQKGLKGERKEKLKQNVPTSPPPLIKGRFSTKNRTQCTWLASEDPPSVLALSCKKGRESFECEYAGSPSSCPPYQSDTKLFWKQIGRSLRKLKQPCRDAREVVKAGMCKNAPRGAHFRLRTRTQSPDVANRAGSKNAKEECADLKDRGKLAEEYCGSTWSSVCTFFFAMVENENC